MKGRYVDIHSVRPLLTALILAIGMLTAFAAAAAAEPAAAYTYEIMRSGTARIIGWTGELPASLDIPAEIDGHVVTEIGDWAFQGAEHLQKVVLPDTVERIGEDAFRKCPDLAEVSFGSSLSEIGAEAFADCTSLSSIELPETIIGIGEYAFWRCSSLAEARIPDHVPELPDGMFGYCVSLEEISLPEDLKAIGAYAFQGSGISQIEIPPGVGEIRDGAFAECADLTELKLPAGITEIAPYMVSQCGSLVSVELPDGVKRIGREAFSHAGLLSEVRIPDTVEEIGDMAFWGCRSFVSARIPNAVRSVEFGTFWSCDNLVEITIPASVRRIEPMAFFATRIRDVYYSGSEQQWREIEIGSTGYDQTGTVIEDSNAALLRTDVHFDSEGPLLPAGLRIRRYSPLEAVSGSSEETLLYGYTAGDPPDGISAGKLLNQFQSAHNMAGVVLSCSGARKPAEASAATGDIVLFSIEEKPVFRAILVMRGDVTGSGLMTLSQLTRMAAAYAGNRMLSGPYLLAGDFDGNGSIGLSDLAAEARLFARVRESADVRSDIRSRVL